MLYNPRVFNKLTIDNYTEVVQGFFRQDYDRNTDSQMEEYIWDGRI